MWHRTSTNKFDKFDASLTSLFATNFDFLFRACKNLMEKSQFFFVFTFRLNRWHAETWKSACSRVWTHNTKTHEYSQNTKNKLSQFFGYNWPGFIYEQSVQESETVRSFYHNLVVLNRLVVSCYFFVVSGSYKDQCAQIPYSIVSAHGLRLNWWFG